MSFPKSINEYINSLNVIKVNKNLFGKSTDALGAVLDPIQDMFSIYTIYKVLNDD